MSLLEQVALVWEALFRTLCQMLRPGLWVPWCMLLLVEMTVVWALWSFAHPALSWFMVPLLVRVLGPGVLHYPEMFRHLPALVGKAELVIVATVAAILIGAATRLFASVFLGRLPDPGAALAEALRRAPALILAQIPFHLLALGLGAGAAAVLGGAKHGGLVRLLGLVLVNGGGLLIQALGLFVTALVVLETRAPWDAWRELPRAWSRALWAALILSGVLALVQFPFVWLESHATTLVDRGTPELVGLIVILQMLVALVTSMIVTGCATLVFLAVIDRAQEEGP